MNKGFKSIILVLVLILALALGLSACDEPEYYSVNVTSNLPGNQSVQAYASAPKEAKGYQKGETAYVYANVAPGSNLTVESVVANGTTLTVDNEGRYPFTVEGNTDVKVTFAKSENVLLNVSADGERGVYVVSQSGNVFAPNTKIEIKATAKEGFALKNFIVNGQSVEPSFEGSVELTLKVDTTVEIKFIRCMETSVFATLQGRLKAKGQYVYDADDNNYDFVHNIETVFGDKQISQVESDSVTGKVYFEYIYGKNNRNITVIQHTSQNTIVELSSDNLFEEYYNPFNLLQPGDFEKVSDTEYVLYNAKKAKAATSALSGWTESIATFEVIVNDGVAVKLHIVTERIKPSEASETYVSTYDFDLSEHGTASVDTLYTQPYPHTADHDTLLAALTAASKKAAYTVRHQGHEVGYVEPEGGETRPGFGDTDYKVYVNEQMVYDSYAGEEHGYVTLNNYVYPFDYFKASNQVVLRDPVNAESVARYQPSFLSFDVALFKKVGENEYTLHQDSMAQLIAPKFAIGNEQAYYIYARDLTIKLKDGALSQVVFTYKTYGIEETVTLSFDFDTAFDVKTDLGLDFDNANKTSVLDDFIGQYKDNMGNFCNVDKTGFTLNGTKIQDLKYYSATEDTTAYFTGLWDNKTVTISKLSAKQLSIVTDNLAIIFVLDKVDASIVKIPSEFYGVWKYKDDNYDDTFIFQTYIAKYNGELLNVISYSKNEGLIARKGSFTYNFEIQQVKDGEETITALYVLIIDNESGSALDQFHARKTTESVGVEIPADYVGLYMSDDEKYKVKISYSDITINGDPFIPASYSDADGFVGTYGNDTEFVISFNNVFGQVDKDKLYISANGGQVLKRTEAFNTNYIGTWTSDKNSAYNYTVVITDTSVTINGISYPVQYDEKYGYKVNIEGDPYTKYILFGYNRYGNPYLSLYDDKDLMVVLFKKVPTKVPEEIIGLWEGMDGTTPITATIDKDGKLQIKIGDGEFVAINAEYNTDENQFEFKLGDKTTFFEYRADTKTFNLYQVEGYNVDFTKSSNFTTPKAMQGTWTSDKGATVTIEKNKIVVTLETGESFTITEATVTVEPGVTHIAFTIGNDEYDIEYGTYGEKLFMQNLSKEMTFYYLTKVTG